MAKYIDSKGEVRIPKQSVDAQKYSDQEITAFMRALTWGVSTDERVSRKLDSEFNQLYVFDDKGKLVPAVGEEEELNGRVVGQRLMEKARNGELFIRALSENGLRQVNLDANHNIRLSKEIDIETTMPKVEIPKEPKRPFFMKFWLPFLFRNEIDEYKAKKAEYDEAVRQDKWTRNFEDSENKEVLRGAADSEKVWPDYGSRFAEKQARLQKDIEEEIKQNERELQQQIVVSDSALEAQSIRQQQEEHEVNSAMSRGLLALGHPDMAAGTGYQSYEQVLQDLDNGNSIQSSVTIGAGNLQLQGLADASVVLQAMAKVLTLNNQYIGRYTPDQPQFHAIARVNEAVFGLLEDAYARRKGDLEKLGIRQADMDLARGVVEVDRAYQSGLRDRARGLENLANRQPVGAQCVAGAMTGEMIRAMVSNNKQGNINEFYTKMGEAKRNTPVSKAGETYGNMKDKLWNKVEFQKFMRNISDMAAMNLMRSPAQLLNEVRQMGVGDMGKQRDMSENSMTMAQPQKEGPEKKGGPSVTG